MLSLMTRWMWMTVAVALAAGCGGDDDDSTGTGGAAGDTGSSGSSGQSGGAGAGGSTGDAGASGAPGAGGASGASAQAAAEAVAKGNALCTGLGDFYWEIGDSKGVLASGSTGKGTVGASTTMLIASSSKWIFGAYAVEVNKADLGKLDQASLTMRSGHTSFTSCAGTKTVQACATAGDNGKVTDANVGKFSYGGGHFQAYGVALGMGSLGTEADGSLGVEVRKVLGLELPIDYATPQLAGGMRASASSYAVFLRRLMGGEIELGKHLGENAVCTLPGSACPEAVYSPAPLPWHYSYGHWVEDDAGSDGAFSSAGAFGFYPWISADRSLYGILARVDLASAGAGGEEDDKTGAGNASVQCGRLIRQAYVTAP